MTMMIRMLMIIMMMKIKYSHNSANFEATTSRFCMVVDINETYRMMMTMMTMMMMMMMRLRLRLRLMMVMRLMLSPMPCVCPTVTITLAGPRHNYFVPCLFCSTVQVTQVYIYVLFIHSLRQLYICVVYSQQYLSMHNNAQLWTEMPNCTQ